MQFPTELSKPFLVISIIPLIQLIRFPAAKFQKKINSYAQKLFSNNCTLWYFSNIYISSLNIQYESNILFSDHPSINRLSSDLQIQIFGSTFPDHIRISDPELNSREPYIQICERWNILHVVFELYALSRTHLSQSYDAIVLNHIENIQFLYHPTITSDVDSELDLFLRINHSNTKEE